MENKYEHIDDVIAKFLAGEATPEEILLLEEWKSLSEQNAVEFSQMEKLFDVSASLKDAIPVDADKAWDRVKKSIQPEKNRGKVVRFNISDRVTPFLRFAAILLLFAGLSLSVYFILRNEENNFAQLESGDSVKSFSLPDGSHLTLNRNSKITFEQNSFTRKRVVKLKGEAFFEVRHDSLAPFVVVSEGLQIQDIGTAFNVNQKSSVIIVSVTEGKVELITPENSSVVLSAGEEASFDILSKSIEKSDHINENLTAYKDKIFIFDNAELGSVVDVLNSIYDVKLLLENPELKNCRITVSFNDEKIEDIADVISETLGLNQRKETGKIILGGNGCK